MLFNYLKKIISKSKVVVIFSITFFILPFIASAATVSALPASNTVSVGNIVTINFTVNTTGTSINNAEAIVQYPADLLEVVSISKSNSIFTLWVEEPSFSNGIGQLKWNGGIATPGYTGSSGTMAQVTFRAKKAGTASVIFTDASVRANDGLGTNVLNSKSNSIIQIGVAKELEVPATVTEKSAVPDKPIVTSITHPNQELWYPNNTGTFEWKVPSGVTSIQTLINKITDSTPTITYDNSVSQKTIHNLNEGTYYFHIRFANAKGWGKILHYKVNVDTVSPEPFVPEIRNEGILYYLKLSAVDVTSGIDYYSVSIDGGKTIKVNKSELVNEEYKLPIINGGLHNLHITAYDKAGNSMDASFSYESIKISAPEIKLNIKEITKGENVIISGVSEYLGNNVLVTLELKNETKTYIQKVDADGTFEIATDKFKSTGTIKIYAQNIITEEVKSEKSNILYLEITEMRVVKVVYVIIWSIILLILFIILALIAYIGWHKYFGLRKKFERELRQTVKDIHAEVAGLKEDLNDSLHDIEILKLDKNLNKKQEKTFLGIKNSIDKIDDFIEKKLRKFM